MAKYSMEKQDKTVAQFLIMAKKIQNPKIKSLTEQLIEQNELSKINSKRVERAIPAPRYAGYYASKYAAETNSKQIVKGGKGVQLKNRK
jgi:hypothetical protein